MQAEEAESVQRRLPQLLQLTKALRERYVEALLREIRPEDTRNNQKRREDCTAV